MAEPVLHKKEAAIRADRKPKETADPFALALGQLELAVN